MVKHYTVDAPLLKLQCTLGEGALWDVRTQRLYFVDIDQYKVYTYEPSSNSYGFETFNHKITALSGLESGEGLIAAIDSGFAYIPFTSLPFPPTFSRQNLIRLDVGVEVGLKEKRFNEGTVDPAGRFYAGTLGLEHGTRDGNMYALRKEADTHSAPLVLSGITCTNGMGWSLDQKTMYFTDSWTGEILAFDYDITTGTMTNRRVFSKLDAEYGEPDGMCIDADGGVWTARWGGGKVVRLTPEGKVDIVIEFPTAWLITCIVFGGESLEDLYVTTAASDYIGEHLPDRCDGGSLFIVRGLGIKGVERFRFKGGIIS